MVEDVENEEATTKVAATSTDLQQLYIAYFGRPCDPSGLDYWLSSGITTGAFAANMYLQPEFNEVNGSLSIRDQVNQIYLNLFNRNGDEGGLDFWVSQIESGRFKLASIGNELVYAALYDERNVIDRQTLNHKTNAAILYTYQIRESESSTDAYQPVSNDPWVTGANLTEAKTFLSGIGYSTVATLEDIQTSIAEFSSTPMRSQLTSDEDTIDPLTGHTFDAANDHLCDNNSTPTLWDSNSEEATHPNSSDPLTEEDSLIQLYDVTPCSASGLDSLNHSVGLLENNLESDDDLLLGVSTSTDNPFILFNTYFLG